MKLDQRHEQQRECGQQETAISKSGERKSQRQSTHPMSTIT
jgi:hypothetical protein